MNQDVTQFLIDSIKVAAELSAAAQAEYRLAIWSLVVSSGTAIIVAGLAYFQRQSYKQFNSRMDEMRELWEDIAFEKGKEAQKEKQK